MGLKGGYEMHRFFPAREDEESFRPVEPYSLLQDRDNAGQCRILQRSNSAARFILHYQCRIIVQISAVVYKYMQGSVD